MNDNTPLFDEPRYSTNIPENATGGTEVIQIHAFDADATHTNSDFLYRINSGAQDKFRINPVNGKIIVANGAVLNKEEKDQYILNVSVTDKGFNSLTSYAVAVINITDVNDEMPYFPDGSKTIHINESTAPNQQVTVYAADDKDLDHHLVYSIVRDSITAFNENGQPVDVDGSGIKVSVISAFYTCY